MDESAPIFETDPAESAGPVPESETDVPGRIVESGQTVDDGRGRIFPCEQCGADLKFHIGQQLLKCPFCGHTKELELSDDAQIEEQDFDAMLEQLRVWREESADEAEDLHSGEHEIRCESCGGGVVFLGTLTSTECPWCGSPIQRNKVHRAERRMRVDGMLPFLVEHSTARDNLSRWVGSQWFAPNEFLKRGADGRFNGVYLPYFTFDSLTFTNVFGRARRALPDDSRSRQKQATGAANALVPRSRSLSAVF